MFPLQNLARKELRGVFCEDFQEDWTRNNGTALLLCTSSRATEPATGRLTSSWGNMHSLISKPPMKRSRKECACQVNVFMLPEIYSQTLSY